MGSGAGCRFSIILYFMPKDAEELTTIESLFDAAPSVALVLRLRSSKIEGGIGLPVLSKSRSMYGIHSQTSNHWRTFFSMRMHVCAPRLLANTIDCHTCLRASAAVVFEFTTEYLHVAYYIGQPTEPPPPNLPSQALTVRSKYETTPFAVHTLSGLYRHTNAARPSITPNRLNVPSECF